MIVFDELAFAKKMVESGFVNNCCTYELSIFAKYLKYLDQRISNEELEQQLKEFAEKNDKYFNWQVDFPMIEKAVKSVEKYELRIPKPTVVTKREWETIINIPDENYRRIAFIMLVVSKYYKNNNTKKKRNKHENQEKVYYCGIQDNDIFKLAKVKNLNKNDKMIMFYQLNKMNLVTMYNSNKISRVVLFVDESTNEDDIICHITDYDHIIMYYEMLNNVPIGICNECQRLFYKSKTKPSEHCYAHRGYQKKQTKVITCIDCCKEFEVNSKNTKTKRCEECQHKKTIQNNKKRVYKYRNKIA